MKPTTYTNSLGQTVTVYAMAKPRPSERTWRGAAKYSLANLGHQAASLRNAGLNHAKG
jgi:hypothetical protein